MGKKKNSTTMAAAPATAKPVQTNARDSSRDELENLRSLNRMLVKQTIEHRNVRDDLAGQVDGGILSSIERDVSGVLLVSLLSDAAAKLDREERETAEVKLKEIRIWNLEAKIQDLERTMEEMRERSREEVQRVRLEYGAVVAEKEEIWRRLEEKERDIKQLDGARDALVKGKREMELGLMVEIDALKERMADLVKDKLETEGSLAEKEHYIEQLKGEKGVLEMEKKKSEMRLMAEMDTLRSRLDVVLKEKETIGWALVQRENHIKQLEGEKSVLEEERAAMEMRMAEEVDEMRENNKEKELYVELLQSQKREREENLQSELVTINALLAERQQYIKQLEEKYDAGEKEKSEMKMNSESRIGGMITELDGWKGRIVEIEEVIAGKLAAMEACIVGLEREKKKETDDLIAQVAELETSRSKIEDELGRSLMAFKHAKADNEAKQNLIDSLMEEKASADRKIKAAETIYKQMLEMLMKAGEELPCYGEAETNEEMKRFAAELNALKESLGNRLAEEQAKRRKLRLLAWLYPTSTLVAAICWGYAAKTR